MARVLFLTQVFPFPLDSGAKIRAYYVLRYLSAQHQVTLVSFVRGDDRPESVAHLEGFCQAVRTVPMERSRTRDLRALLVAGLTGRPVVIVRDEIGQMHAVLRELVEQEPFDIVHADQTSMAQYALYAASQSARSASVLPRLLLDAHNALYRIPQRLAVRERNPLRWLFLRREAGALMRYESQLCRWFDHVVFVADQDRQALQAGSVGQSLSSAVHPSRFTVIPICVDPVEQPAIQHVPNPRAITHLGTMFWPPNVEGVLWFAREVFPQVLARVPEAQFVIVGKNPPAQVQSLPTQIRNVDVAGYVSNPAPYLAQTAAFVVPLHAAGGMRVKILDGWCWGLPIVSTTIGAEGIALREGENILIADTPEVFAQAVTRLLQEPALGEKLRQNGRRWVEEQYDWRRVYGKWDVVYEKLSVQPSVTT